MTTSVRDVLKLLGGSPIIYTHTHTLSLQAKVLPSKWCHSGRITWLRGEPALSLMGRKRSVEVLVESTAIKSLAFLGISVSRFLAMISCFDVSWHPPLHTLQLHSAKVALDSHDGFEKGIHVQIPKEIWAIAGCSDFFQNLNFALSQTEAHSPWVTLSAPAVKLERKLLHFASTSITAVCAGECVHSSVYAKNIIFLM